MDNKTLNKLKELIYHNLGINFSSEKNYLLETKIKRILQKENFNNIDDFYNSIKEGNKNTFETLIKYITTNHTFFFREKEHYEILVNLIKKRNLNHSVIWCGASSTGEEVYSIIITLLENNIKDFLIIASDINSKVLHHMNKGIYNEDRLQETPKHIRFKYFTKNKDGKYEVKKELRHYLKIKKLNLIDTINFENKFDFIFCRNVLIYFDNDTKNHVIHNLLFNLKKFGFLFIGHTETLLNSEENIKRVYNSVYQKIGD